MIGAGRPDMICDDSSANFSVYNVYSWQELACNSERPITTDQIIANLVLLRLGLAEGCAKPSLPIGDDHNTYIYSTDAVCASCQLEV